MKIFKLIFLFLCFIPGISATVGTLIPLFKEIRIRIPVDSEKDTSRINSLTRAGFIFITKSKTIKEAKACIDTAVSICEKKNIEIPSLLHLLRAEYYFSVGDFGRASEDAKVAMEQSKRSGETEVLVKTMFFLGKYCLRTFFFKESIDYFSKSISLSKTIRLKGIIPRSYEGISGVYGALNDLEGYRRNLQNMIDAAFTENDSASVVEGFSRLGSSFTEKNRDFRKADSLLRRSYEISLIRKDTSYAAFSLANIGWNFYVEKMYDSSLSYYNKSLRYSLAGKRYPISANSLGNIGTIYRDLGNPEKSIKCYLKAIDYAKKVNDWYSMSWIYKDMSEMYIRTKDTSNAFKSFVFFKQFSDSLIMNRNNKGLADARVRYEADTHNKEVELLSLRVKNQRFLIYGFTGFLVLILVIGLLLLNQAKVNAGRRISEMNRKISEITQANLRQQMNPHFIFNTLNSIQYYMYQHDKLATNNYLTKFSKLMRKVLENSQNTSVTLRDELDALNLYLELECIRFKDKFDYEIKVDEDIDPLLFKVPAMLIQPYVENSICHGLIPGEGKGSVKIDLKLEKDFISCTIEDNGIGRQAAQEKRKKSECDHNSLGTQIVSSRLDLVNTLYGSSLKTIYTDLKNENDEPAGTRVEIHIPIMT